MVICAVFNCNSNSDKKLKRNMNDSSFKETKFFRFPKNKEIAKIWIQKCGRKEKFNIQSSYICSKHFVQEHYRRNLQHELLNYSPKNSKKLKDDAVPTENLPSAIESKSSETVSERLGRYIKKQRQETVTDILFFGTFENLDCVEVHTNNEVQEKNSKCDQSTSTEDLNECKSKSPTKEQLKNDNKMLSKQCYFLKQENDCLKNIFTPNQRKKMAKKGNRVKWNIEDISESIAIYSSGPKAYRLLLKKKYPFPAVSTLKKWVSKIDINPGCLTFVFVLMGSASLSKYQKVCILMFDEMKIKKSFEYDQKSDILLKAANYVQVVMARGLFENWKQPLYYSYDQPITQNILNKLIQKLHQIGYDVVGVVSDLGASNQKLWNTLEVTVEKPFFVNPCDAKSKIYVFSDVPHLIKLFRNHFLDSGIFFEEKLITNEPLVELLENMSLFDLKISRITSTHLTVKEAERQKVKFATQLFSHTNSCALKRMGALGIAKSQYWFELSIILKTVNDWFDLFNSKVPKIDSRPRMAAYGLAAEEHEKILTDINNLVQNMRIGNRKELLPFQKAILKNNVALQMMYKDLEAKYNTKYLLTYRLNQDPLELFFGIMRAKGGLYDHPSALQFKYRLRNYLLGRNESIISQSANVEEDREAAFKMNVDEGYSIPNSNNEEIEIDDCENLLANRMLSDLTEPTVNDTIEELNDLEFDGLEHIGGYIIRSLKKNIPNLIENYCEQNPTTSFTWTDMVSEGMLHKPNENFMEKLQKLNQIFVNYNSKLSRVNLNYLNNLLTLANDVELDSNIKKKFFRCKIFFKIRIDNSEISANSRKRKRKVNKILT